MMLLTCLLFCLIVHWPSLRCDLLESFVVDKEPDYKSVSVWIGNKLNFSVSKVLSHAEHDRDDIVLFNQWIVTNSQQQETCNLQADYIKLNHSLVLHSKKCKHWSDELDHNKVLKWALEKLGLNLNKTVEQRQKSFKDRDIYTTEIWATKRSKAEELCLLIVEHYKYTGILSVKLSVCGMEKLSSNYKQIFTLLTQKTDIFNMDIMSYTEDASGHGVKHRVEVGGMNSSKDILKCSLDLECLQSNHICSLKVKECGLKNENVDQGALQIWLSKLLKFHNERVLQIHEKYLLNKIEFYTVIEGSFGKGNDKICNILVEYLPKHKAVQMKWKLCVPVSKHTEQPNYKIIAKWAADLLEVQLKSVRYHKERYVDDKIIYTLDLNVVNQLGSSICFVVAEYVSSTGMFYLKLHHCKSHQTSDTHRDIFNLISDQLNIYNMNIIKSKKTLEGEKNVYSIKVVGTDFFDDKSDCTVTVNYVKGNDSKLASVNCSLPFNDVNINNAVKWASKILNLTVVKLFKSEQKIYGKDIIYFMSFNAMKGSATVRCNITENYSMLTGLYVIKSKVCNRVTSRNDVSLPYNRAVEWAAEELHLKVKEIFNHSERQESNKTFYKIKLKGERNGEQMCHIFVEYWNTDQLLHLKLSICLEPSRFNFSRSPFSETDFERALEFVAQKSNFYGMDVINFISNTNGKSIDHEFEIKTGTKHCEIIVTRGVNEEPWQISKQTCDKTDKNGQRVKRSSDPKRSRLNRPPPSYEFVVTWLKKILHLEVINVSHHLEKDKGRVVSYELDLDVKNGSHSTAFCFIAAEYSRQLNNVTLKIQSCTLNKIDEKYKQVLLLIPKKTGMFNIRVISKSEEMKQKTVRVYHIDITGINSSLKDQSCSFNIECKSSSKCVLKGKQCEDTVSSDLDILTVAHWISGNLNMEILQILTENREMEESNTVYTLQYEAKNETGSIIECNLVCSYLSNVNSFILKSSKCKPSRGEVGVPIYQNVAGWLASAMNIQIIEINQHVEKFIGSDVLYTMRLQTFNNSVKVMCLSITEYLKRTDVFKLKLHLCDKDLLEEGYEKILNLLSQRDMYNITVIAHDVQSSLNVTNHSVQVDGINMGSVHLICQIEGTCLLQSVDCIIKSTNCFLVLEMPILSRFIRDQLSLPILRIIRHQHRIIDSTVAYDIDLEVKNRKDQNKICKVIVNDAPGLVITAQNCTLSNKNMSYQYVINWIMKSFNNPTFEVSKHEEVSLPDGILYSFHVKLKNVTNFEQFCFGAVKYTKQHNLLRKKMYICSAQSLQSSLKDALMLIIQKVDVNDIDIISQIKETKNNTLYYKFVMQGNNSVSVPQNCSASVKCKPNAQCVLSAQFCIPLNSPIYNLINYLSKKLKIEIFHVITTNDKYIGNNITYDIKFKAKKSTEDLIECSVLCSYMTTSLKYSLISVNCAPINSESVKLSHIQEFVSNKLNLIITRIFKDEHEVHDGHVTHVLEFDGDVYKWGKKICKVEIISNSNSTELELKSYERVPRMLQDIGFQHVINWATSIMNLDLVEVKNSTEIYLPVKVMYSVQFIAKDSNSTTLSCFVIVEMSKDDNLFRLKIHTCADKPIKLVMLNVLLEIAKESTIDDMKIIQKITHKETQSVTTRLFINGMDRAGVKQTCNLVVRCTSESLVCKLNNEVCTKRTTSVDLTQVRHWISKKLSLGVVRVMEDDRLNQGSNIIFNLKFEAVNDTNRLLFCKASCNYILMKDAFVLEDSSCKLTSSRLAIPNPENVLMVVGRQLNMKIEETLDHNSTYTNQKVTYVFEVRASNESHKDLLCYISAEYLKSDQDIYTKIHYCDSKPVEYFDAQVLSLITQKGRIYNTTVVKRSVNDTTNAAVYSVEIKGNSSIKMTKTCRLDVICDKLKNHCTLSSMNCEHDEAATNIKRIAKFLSKSLKMIVYHIIKETHKSENGKLIYDINFETENILSKPHSCNAIVSIISATKKIDLMSHTCRPKTTRHSDEVDETEWAANIMNIKITKKEAHKRIDLPNRIVHTIRFKGQNNSDTEMSCFAIVEYWKDTDVKNLKMHTCTVKPIDSKFQKTLVFLTKKLGLKNINVISYDIKVYEGVSLYNFIIKATNSNSNEKICEVEIQALSSSKYLLKAKTCHGKGNPPISLSKLQLWISEKMKVNILRVIKETHHTVGNTITYDVKFEAKNITGRKMICEAVCSYMNSQESFLITESVCKENKLSSSLPNYKTVAGRVASLLKIQIINVVNHLETDLDNKMIYSLEVKAVKEHQTEIHCFVLAECSKEDEKINIKIHSCSSEPMQLSYKAMLTLLTKKIQFYNMTVVKYSVEETKVDTVYKLNLKGNNDANIQQMCKLVVKCTKTNVKCLLQLKNCMIQKSKVNIETITEFITMESRLTVQRVIEEYHTVIDKKIIYIVKIEGRNSSGVIQICDEVVHGYLSSNKLTLVSQKCRPKGADLDTNIIKWAVKVMNVKLNQVVTQEQVTLSDKVVYQFQIKAVNNDNTELTCLVIAEAYKSDNKLQMKLHKCTVKPLQPIVQQIYLLLTDKIMLNNIKVIDKDIQKNASISIFKLKVNGTHASTTQTCTVVVKCKPEILKCILKSKTCVKGPVTQIGVKDIQKWIYHSVKVNNVHITKISHKTEGKTTIYSIKFKASNSTGNVICSATFFFNSYSNKLTLKTTKCALMRVPVFKSPSLNTTHIVYFISQKLNLNIIHIIKKSHKVLMNKENFVLTVEAKKANDVVKVCQIIVDHYTNTNHMVLLSHICRPKVPIIGYGNVIKWATSLMNVTLIKVLKHKEISLTTRVVYTFDIKAKDNSNSELTCFVIVESSKGTYNLHKKYHTCTVKPLENTEKEIMLLITKVTPVKDINIVSKVVNASATSLSYNIIVQDSPLKVQCHLQIECKHPVTSCTIKSKNCNDHKLSTNVENNKYLVHFISNKLHLTAVHFIKEDVKIKKDKTLYVIKLKGKKENGTEYHCRVVVSSSKTSQNMILTTYSCQSKTENKDIQNIVNWATKELNITSFNIIKHNKVEISNKVIYTFIVNETSNLETVKTCFITVESSKSNNVLFLKLHSCKTKPIEPKLENVLMLITTKLDIKNINIVSEDIKHYVKSVEYKLVINGMNDLSGESTCTLFVKCTGRHCVLKQKKCDAANPKEEITMVKDLISHELHLNIVKVINEKKYNMGKKVIYSFKLEAKNKNGILVNCRLQCSYVPGENKIIVKRYKCIPTTVQTGYIVKNYTKDEPTIIKYFSHSINMVVMHVIQQNVKISKNKVIYTFKLNVKDENNGVKTCKAVVSTVASSDKLVLITETCKKGVNGPNYQTVAKWVVDKLNIDLKLIQKHKEIDSADKLIYTFNIKAINNTNSELSCFIIVESYKDDNKLLLKLYSCTVKPIKQSYEGVLQFLSGKIQIQNIKLTSINTKQVKNKYIYTIIFTGNDESNINKGCKVLVECKSSKCVLINKKCNEEKLLAKPDKKFITEWISEELHLTAIHIINKQEKVQGDNISYSITFDAKNMTQRYVCKMVSQYLMTSNIFVLKKIKCKSASSNVPKNVTINENDISKFLSQKLNLVIVKVIHNDKKVLNNKIIYKVQLEGKNKKGEVQSCHIIISGQPSSQKLLITSKNCKSKDNKKIVYWATKLVNLHSVKVIQQKEMDLPGKIIYTFHVKATNGSNSNLACFIVVEMGKASNVLHLKLQTCSVTPVTETLEHVLLLITSKSKIQNISILSQDVKNHKDYSLYSIIMNGIDHKKKNKVCELVIKCTSVRICQIKKKSCDKKIVPPDVKVVTEWISQNLQLDIVHVISEKHTIKEDKVVYQMHFEVKNTTEILLCHLSCSYFPNNNAFQLNNIKCKVKKPIEDIPNYKIVAGRLAGLLQIQLIEIVHHTEENLKNKVQYSFEIKGTKETEAETRCFVLAEYSKTEKTIIMKLNTCDLQSVQPNYKEALLLIFKIPIYNMSIISHTIETLLGKSVHKIQVLGNKTDYAVQICKLIVECKKQVCTLESRKCEPYKSNVDFKHVIAFVSKKLKLDVVQVLQENHKTKKDKVFFVVKLEGKDQKKKVHMCKVTVHGYMLSNKLVLESHSCKPKDAPKESSQNVVNWAVKQMELNLVQVEKQNEIDLPDRTVYTFNIKAKNDTMTEISCFIIVESFKDEHGLHLKLHTCTVKPVENKEQEILLLITENMPIENMMIVTQDVQPLKDSLIYTFLIKGNDNHQTESTCNLIIQCDVETGECKLKSKTCTKLKTHPEAESSIKNVTHTLSDMLNLNIVSVVNEEHQILKESIVYKIKFQAKNETDKTLLCSVQCEYFSKRKQLVVDWVKCKEEIIIKGHLSEQDILKFVLKNMNIQLINIIDHHLEMIAEKAVHHFEVKAKNNSNTDLTCIITVEHVNNRTLRVPLISCSDHPPPPELKPVLTLITDKLDIDEINVMSTIIKNKHKEPTYILMVTGSNAQKPCKVIVKCKMGVKDCKIKSKKCISRPFKITIDKVKHWITETLQLDVTQITQETHKTVGSNIVYDMVFEAKNETVPSMICSIKCEYVHQIADFILKKGQCKMIEVSVVKPDYKSVLAYIKKATDLELLNVLHHTVTQTETGVKYTYDVKMKDKTGADLTCLIIAEYSVVNSSVNVKLKACHNQEVEPQFKKVLLSLSNKMNIDNIMVVSHANKKLNDKEIHELEVVGSSSGAAEKKCNVVVETKPGGKVVVKSKKCKVKKVS